MVFTPYDKPDSIADTAPRAFVLTACPLESNVPFPAVVASVTSIPGTAFPYSSNTAAITRTLPPTGALAGSAASVSPVALPLIAVAWKVCGEFATASEPSPSARTDSSCDPEAGPRVHSTRASPAAPVSSTTCPTGPVIACLPGTTGPTMPAFGRKRTVTPGTGRPSTSTTFTTIGCDSTAPATAVWLSPAAIARDAPGASLTAPAHLSPGLLIMLGGFAKSSMPLARTPTYAPVCSASPSTSTFGATAGCPPVAGTPGVY